MPFYDYRCPNDHTWAKQRPVDDRRDPTECPECGAAGKIAPSTGVYGSCPTGTPKFYGR